MDLRCFSPPHLSDETVYSSFVIFLNVLCNLELFDGAVNQGKCAALPMQVILNG